MSTLRIPDRMLVLDKGRFVEEGSPEELLRGDGLYRSLTRGQDYKMPTVCAHLPRVRSPSTSRPGRLFDTLKFFGL